MINDTATSFLPQPDNGIPIAGFYGDPRDRNLPHLLPLLRRLGEADDVRPELRTKFDVRSKLLKKVRGLRQNFAYP